jgi:hypothetical protein
MITIVLYLNSLHTAKFITMPPGKKAPPQQSSLTELWRKKQNPPAASASTSRGQSKPDAAIDTNPKTLSERAYSLHMSRAPRSLIRQDVNLWYIYSCDAEA